jgi:hypothetical protein
MGSKNNYNKFHRIQNIHNHPNKSELDKSQGTASNHKIYLLENFFIFLIKNIFTLKLNRTLETGQSVQLLADRVQFPQEISQ